MVKVQEISCGKCHRKLFNLRFEGSLIYCVCFHCGNKVAVQEVGL